ncbi:hypothetical protein [Telmatospirillum sp.]|uniref:phage major capsid protein n=1 Tax=Telmatospirillum sp. TaxID=2079197 RepID=UPI00284B71BF|nr:hypothetical protein [Telmatospirillum sp.]MDR3436428.1 hypothetical protein [Telmatospirillum sp.]
MSAVTKDICDLVRNRRSPEDLLAGLLSNDNYQSKTAGMKLCAEAKDYGLNVENFLSLAIDPSKSPATRRYDGLNGLEASLAYLNLPVKNDYASGVLLQAAANTFVTYDGTRALFPAVIDSVLRWKNKINMIEYVEPMLGNSRGIAGNELITTFVEDDTKARTTSTISEGGPIPIKTVQTSEQSVKIFKHGSGYKFTYEFMRRAALDVMTPFAARVQRQLELSKVIAATGILINGDGVNAAATVVSSTSQLPYGFTTGYTATGALNYKALLGWLVGRAKSMWPVDVVVGNYDMYCNWLLMFTPTLSGQTSEAQALADSGVGPNLKQNLPILLKGVQFVLSSTVPNGQLIGLTCAECLEELIESGSQIAESERLIQTQEVIYVRTENTGYKLVFPLSRNIIDFTQ